MNRMKVLVGALLAGLVLGFAGGAGAQEEEAIEQEAAPDWDRAFENAYVIDTFEEQGVVWETYLDEEQGLMWSQPVGASEEDVMEAATSGGKGGEGLLEDCIYFGLVPYTLTIYDTAESYETLSYSLGEIAYSGTCGENCVRYTGCGNVEFNDINGYLHSYARSPTNYCDSDGYNARYWDLDSGGGWNDNNDDQDCATESPYTYHEMKEAGDVAGETQWDYHYVATKVARHEYYACDFWHYVEVSYQNTPE